MRLDKRIIFGSLFAFGAIVGGGQAIKYFSERELCSTVPSAAIAVFLGWLALRAFLGRSRRPKDS